MKSSTLYLLAILLLFFNHALAQGQAPGIEWQKTIGGSTYDMLEDAILTDDGGYVVCGSSYSGLSGDRNVSSNGISDYWILKLDSSGNIEWQSSIGGTHAELFRSISQTSDGGYILGGHSRSGIGGDKTEANRGLFTEDYWVVKIDSAGNIEWDKTIGGSEDEHLYEVQQTIDGGFILAGNSKSDISGDKSQNSKGGFDIWMVKLDSSGNILWQNTIGGNDGDVVNSIAQTIDGGYILGAGSFSDISGDKSENSKGGGDCWIIKLDSTGNILWQKTIGGSITDYVLKIIQTLNGEYLMGATSNSDISGDKAENSKGGADFWLLKLDSVGNILWQKTIGGNAYDNLSSLSKTIDEGYILGGNSTSNISGDKTENNKGLMDFWLVKIDSIGNILWDKTIGGSDSDVFRYVAQTTSEDYIVGGWSTSDISGDKTENSKGFDDYWLLKLSPNVVLSNATRSYLLTGNDLKFSPNPITESSTLQIDGLRENAELNLKVISTSGATMHQMYGSLSSINRKLGTQLMELPQGIYILQVTTPDGVRSVKVVR